MINNNADNLNDLGDMLVDGYVDVSAKALHVLQEIGSDLPPGMTPGITGHGIWVHAPHVGRFRYVQRTGLGPGLLFAADEQ